MRILILSPIMLKGYGVPEVIAAQSEHLRRLGIDCHVGCMDDDQSFTQIPTHRIGAAAEDVLNLVDTLQPDVVIAHASPYFETLPAVKTERGIPTIAYEHGEPTPDFFLTDASERRKRDRYKREHVYPYVDRVVAISDFIRHDIGWPEATVIYNGCDHIPDEGSKRVVLAPGGIRPLRVGLLMRLGEGESLYKGKDLLTPVRDATAHAGSSIQWEVMGRGNNADRQDLQALGFQVHLNATDEQRSEFLRDIDVFVSLSKWEGFNLPLVEAASLGTPALALDTGSHPEVTPFVFSDLGMLAEQIATYASDRSLLAHHGRISYSFVRSRFLWQRSATELLAVIASIHQPDLLAQPSRSRARELRGKVKQKWRNGSDLYREKGMNEFLKVSMDKLRRKSDQ